MRWTIATEDDAARPAENRDRRETLALVALLLAAAALRLYRIGAESIWMDEAFTLRDMHLPPSGFNLYRPAYYVALWLWMQASGSDAWARGLAAVLGVANVWATYRLGRAAAGRGVGLIAGTACALSPLEINHSQEIRMYTAASFLGVLGSLAALRLGRGAPWWRWAAWAGWRALAILTSSFDALLLIGDALLLKRSPRTRALGMLLAATATAASLVVLANSKTVAAITNWTTVVPPLTPVSLVRPLVGFAAWWATPLPAVWTDLPGPAGVLRYAALGVVLVVLLVVAVVHPGLNAVRPLVGWALAPLAVLAAASVAVAPLSLWLERYLMFTAPYAFVLASAAVLLARRTRPWLAAAVVALYLWALIPSLAWYYQGYHRTDWRGVAAAVRKEVQPGDSVVVSHGAAYEPLAHYLRPERVPTALPIGAEAKPDRAALRNALGPLCGGGKRVFLVQWLAGPAETRREVRGTVFGSFSVDGWRSFEGLELYVISGPRP